MTMASNYIQNAINAYTMGESNNTSINLDTSFGFLNMTM